jgi:hypothetical protein
MYVRRSQLQERDQAGERSSCKELEERTSILHANATSIQSSSETPYPSPLIIIGMLST